MLASKLGNVINTTIQHQLVHSGVPNGLRSGLSLDRAVNLFEASGSIGCTSFTKAVRYVSNSILVRASFPINPSFIPTPRSIQSHRNIHTITRFQPNAYKSNPALSLKTLSSSRTSNCSYFAALHTVATNTGSNSTEQNKTSHSYAWIDEEARGLIAKAYKRHRALADMSMSFPPSLSINDLERIGKPYHYVPRDFVDRVALNLMKFLRLFVHGFFREKYDHHAVCLETVAAVPGIVGSFHRHLRSLRRMKRDHGWITVMQEEAENERMHLLIFMKVCEPTALERGLVLAAQGVYLSFYSLLYLVNSRAAHRLTGYLEEEAHRAYTEYLQSIDSGKLPNKEAPQIAKTYYRLPDDATMRDVILHVRADEAMHRDVNHHFGDKYMKREADTPLTEAHSDRT